MGSNDEYVDMHTALSADQEHTTVEKILSLYPNQEDTDSNVVLYCKYAHEQGYESAGVCSPESDAFLIPLHYAKGLSYIL